MHFNSFIKAISFDSINKITPLQGVVFYTTAITTSLAIERLMDWFPKTQQIAKTFPKTTWVASKSVSLVIAVATNVRVTALVAKVAAAAGISTGAATAGLTLIALAITYLYQTLAKTNRNLDALNQRLVKVEGKITPLNEQIGNLQTALTEANDTNTRLLAIVEGLQEKLKAAGTPVVIDLPSPPSPTGKAPLPPPPPVKGKFPKPAAATETPAPKPAAKPAAPKAKPGPALPKGHQEALAAALAKKAAKSGAT